MSPYECMICGSREHVLREGKVCLCARCVEALGAALGDKLWDGERARADAPVPRRDEYCSSVTAVSGS